ncbi:hypothetical protein H6P81_017938 [Aristolochia fimbriata]|uniref:Uncharacterized protein n=1 Tax=Aristolochia fimbriata TaxID=158543 RepID=A0AAV7E003_ARIFI|nr:hypothetical protein H6P81_017938 [Aristolochia fimbriata]
MNNGFTPGHEQSRVVIGRKKKDEEFATSSQRVQPEVVAPSPCDEEHRRPRNKTHERDSRTITGDGSNATMIVAPSPESF